MSKNKLSKKTLGFVEKSMDRGAREIVAEVKEQSSQKHRDLMTFVYIFGIVGPALALIQAIKIYAEGSAIGVSLLYWGAYLIGASLWFGYGMYYRNKAIMVTYAAWIVIIVILLNGILIYG